MTDKPEDNNKKLFKTTLALYRESVKNVPLLKYSWVLIATICILTFTAYFKLKNSDVFFYAIAVLIISFSGFVFSFLLKTQDIIIRIALYILVYCIIATMGTAVLGFASFILTGQPEFYRRWFPEQTPEPNNTSLEILDRTNKIRELLSSESKNSSVSIGNYKIDIWSAPNNFSIEQIVSLADVAPSQVIKSLIPLLVDKNVTVSSGAVITISNILSKISDSKKRKQLIELIPKVENRNFVINLNGASMQNHDFTPLKETEIFYGAEMNASDFSNCKLDSINFKTSKANYAKFIQSSLSDANFDMAHLEGAMFWGVAAPRASFRLAFLKKTDFSNHTTLDKPTGLPFRTSTSYIPANLEEADFGDGQLYGTNFSGARIGLAKFNGASIANVNFSGSFLIGMARGVTEQYIQSQQPAFTDKCIY